MVRAEERGTVCAYGNTNWSLGSGLLRVRWAGAGRVPSVVDVPTVATSRCPCLMWGRGELDAI